MSAIAKIALTIALTALWVTLSDIGDRHYPDNEAPIAISLVLLFGNIASIVAVWTA